MISRFARAFATFQIAAFVILLIWRPSHSVIPALAFLAGISATLIFDKVSRVGAVPQLEVLRVPPEGGDIERGIMGMIGTEETFMRTIKGLMFGAWNGSEQILYAAIKHPDGRVFAVSRPGRHGHVQQLMEMLNSGGLENNGPDRQGFITTLGSFVNRTEGLEIAQRSEQIVQKHPQPSALYSEDMWEAV
jgi:hypothetical protein